MTQGKRFDGGPEKPPVESDNKVRQPVRSAPANPQKHSPGTNPQTAQDKSRVPGTRSLLYRLRFWAYCRWPSIFPDPELSELREEVAARDALENAATLPPDNERVEIHVLWVVELYPPSQITSLLEALRDLGWDRGTPPFFGPSPTDWIQGMRERILGGSWLDLGMIVRRGDRKFITGQREAPLPEGIDYAFGHIQNLTSSLTCVVLGFVLSEESACTYDKTLRQPRATVYERTKHGYSIHSPVDQKAQEIRDARQRLRVACSGWFRTNLPGVFSSGILSDGAFPTLEFLTLRAATPFPATSPPRDSYLSVLGLENSFDSWLSDELPGFRLGGLPHRDDDAFLLRIAALTTEIDATPRLPSYGGPTRHGYANYLHRGIVGVLTRYAISALIEGGIARLNRFRDKIPTGSWSPSQVQRFLEFLRTVLQDSTDVTAISSDLALYTRRRSSFSHDVPEFKPSNPKFQRGTLTDLLRREIAARAAMLRRAERDVRDLLSQYASVQSTYVNLKLQRHLWVLTWVMVGLALATLLVGIAGLRNGNTLGDRTPQPSVSQPLH